MIREYVATNTPTAQCTSITLSSHFLFQFSRDKKMHQQVTIKAWILMTRLQYLFIFKVWTFANWTKNWTQFLWTGILFDKIL